MKAQKFEDILGSKASLDSAWTTQDFVSTHPFTLQKVKHLGDQGRTYWKFKESLDYTARP